MVTAQISSVINHQCSQQHTNIQYIAAFYNRVIGLVTPLASGHLSRLISLWGTCNSECQAHKSFDVLDPAIVTRESRQS